MGRVRRAAIWFVLGTLFCLASFCVTAISLPAGERAVRDPAVSAPIFGGWDFDGGDSGSDGGGGWDFGGGDDGGSWDFGGDDGGSWDFGGDDSGSWDFGGGDDGGSWDFGGDDGGSWDSGGSDSGSW